MNGIAKIKMRSILFVIFSFIFSVIYSQDTVFMRHAICDNSGKKIISYKTDTVKFNWSFETNVLYGTRVLPGTRNQEEASGYSLWLKDIGVTDCKNEGEYLGNTQIETIVKTDSTLNIETKVIDNCCHAFLCDITVKDDSILDLIYYGYGVICSCECCFGLTYNMYISKKVPDFVEAFKKLKYVMINEDKKSLKPLK